MTLKSPLTINGLFIEFSRFKTRCVKIKSTFNFNTMLDSKSSKLEEFLKLHWDSMSWQEFHLGVIWWTNPSWKAIKLNAKAANIFEYPQDQLEGIDVFKLLLISNHEEIRGIFERLGRNKGAHQLISQNITKTGRIITCQWNNATLLSPTGEPIGVISVIDDISNKITRQAELDVIVGAFPGVVFRFVRKGKNYYFVAVNEEVFESFGLRPDDLNNKSISQVLGEKNDLADLVDEIFKDRKVIEKKIKLHLESGSKYFQAKGSRFNGNKAVVCLFDVTEEEGKREAIASAIQNQSPNSAIGTISSIIDYQHSQNIERLNASSSSFVKEIASMSARVTLLSNRVRQLETEISKNRDRLNALSSLEEINIYIKKLPGGWWAISLIFVLAIPVAVVDLIKAILAKL